MILLRMSLLLLEDRIVSLCGLVDGRFGFRVGSMGGSDRILRATRKRLYFSLCFSFLPRISFLDGETGVCVRAYTCFVVFIHHHRSFTITGIYCISPKRMSEILFSTTTSLYIFDYYYLFYYIRTYSSYITI